MEAVGSGDAVAVNPTCSGTKIRVPGADLHVNSNSTTSVSDSGNTTPGKVEKKVGQIEKVLGK